MEKNQTNETSTQEKKMRTLNVLGYEFKENSCSAVEYNLYSKKFKEFLAHSGKEQGFKLSMNHIKVFELLDEATFVTITEEIDTTDKWLHIETEEYKVSIKIPKEVE